VHRILFFAMTLLYLVLPFGEAQAQTYEQFYSNLPPTVVTLQGHDPMDTSNRGLLHYRRLYQNGTTAQPHELVGQWNGVNKGIVEIVGYGQFIKDIRPDGNGQVFGDNIQVKQVQANQVRLDGWEPIVDYRANGIERRGSFQLQPPSGRGYFGQGTTFSYADGMNPKKDPARLLVDEVVKIDDQHMLGRAVAKFGPLRIPLAYFVLERRQ